MRKLTHLQELISDTTSDAMSNAQDMDTGITQLARAASIVLVDDMHDIIKFELERIGKLFGQNGTAGLSFRADATPDYVVCITVYPSGRATAGIETIFGANLPAAIAKAEIFAAEWVEKHPVMCAADLGYADERGFLVVEDVQRTGA